jgi:excisionase family DNA binding protein
MERHLTYAEAAVVTGIKVGTLYALVARKRIPHTRLGRRLVRFPAAQLQKWLTEHLVLPDVGAAKTK